MMFQYPYYGFSDDNRYSRYGYRYPNYSYRHNVTNVNVKREVDEKKTPKNESSSNCQTPPPSFEEKRQEDTDVPVFEIFGIKLYSDDILILCLLFFLYQEGVKDQSLFISLILLLLS